MKKGAGAGHSLLDTGAELIEELDDGCAGRAAFGDDRLRVSLEILRRGFDGRGAVARRYGRYIHHWEIWNEPDNQLFWKPAPDPAAYADDEITEESLGEIAPDSNALPLKLGNEFLSAESVLFWVFQKIPVKPAIKRVTRHLLKEEPPAALEHPTDLGHGPPPYRNMVDYPEVKHRIEKPVLRFNGGDVADAELQPIRPIG